MKQNEPGEGRHFDNINEIEFALENKTIKFVPLSNLEYDVEVKLLNEEKEFYKFF